jgi:hypothetical protein
MARFVSGEVVVVPFPFTDLTSAKVRPTLVLASLSRGDVILCQITSQTVGHPEAIPIHRCFLCGHRSAKGQNRAFRARFSLLLSSPRSSRLCGS